MLIVGLRQRHDDASRARMPAQWQAVSPHIGHIERQKGDAAFGVLHDSGDEGNIDCTTGIEVTAVKDLARELSALRIPPQTYAVYRHVGHVSEIRHSWKGIFAAWLAQAGRKLVDAPHFER
jgi:AraC family transcriptional regulator